MSVLQIISLVLSGFSLGLSIGNLIWVIKMIRENK